MFQAKIILFLLVIGGAGGAFAYHKVTVAELESQVSASKQTIRYSKATIIVSKMGFLTKKKR